MKITLKRLALATASAGLLTIYGCGGGGSGTAASTTFSGVAATGAPFVGGSVVVTDATGATAGTATTGADGSYTLNFDPAKFTAPFVITVTGNIGNAEETLVSVQPSSGNATVNITPITNAIAALLSSSGNPLDLVANIATDKANITAANVGDVEKGFRDALAANMTAMGLDPATDNLLNTTFNAKLDKLLDNVKIEVTSSGEIKMSTSAGSAVDDLADTGTTPAAVKSVTLAKGVKPSAALAANLPAAAAGQTPIGIDALENARLAMNACFALPAATRYSAGTYASQCANLATASYKHEGRTAAQEFGTTAGLIADSGNDGMVFQKPEILRQLSATPTRERLVVRLSAKRADGQMRELTTVAENNPVGYTGWQLVGNQRDFETFVNGVAANRISANSPASNRYETGLNLYVGDSASISSVVVTGPGLTTPITLKRKSGCDFLAIVRTSDGTTPNCASFYRVRSLLTSGSAFTPPAGSAYLFGSQTDADITAIQPLDLYKFVITKTDTSTLTYWNRLRSRPLTVAEMAQVKYVDFTAATKALMTTATLYTGGAKPTVAWTVPANAPRPFLTYFFHANGSDRTGVSFTSTSATIACTSNSDCAGSGLYNTNLTTTGQYGFQTVSRNRFDTQIFTQLWQ